MLKKAFLILPVVGVLQYLLKLRIFLDWDKPFPYRNAPGPCAQIHEDGGAEDMTRIDENLVVFTSGFGRPNGKVYLMDLSGFPVYHELNITNPPSVTDFMLSAHGITTWKDPITGQLTLFVITHPAAADRVEVFELIGRSHLKHIRSITDGQFRYMNNLVAVDKDKFYITQFQHFRDWNKIYVEIFLFLHLGKIFYYDGHKAREVARDLFIPNGINISPDKTTIYVAEFGKKRLLGFQRKPNNDLDLMWAHDVNSGPDNVEVDYETGDLWLGCHPLFWAIVDIEGKLGLAHRSQVLKVKMQHNMVEEIVDVYADPDGTEIFGSTVATRVGDKLVIGSVSHQAIVCDIKYIV